MISNLSAVAQENAAGCEEVQASVELQNSTISQLSDMNVELVKLAGNLKKEAEVFKM